MEENRSFRDCLGMIEDQEIRLDGVRYLWSYDSDRGASQTCWYWSIAERYMTPSIAVQGRLNQSFIAERAADIVATLEITELDRFYAILKAMGATDEQVAGIFGDDPERLPRAMAAPMKRVAAKIPPAAHLPFNSPPIRDWFFNELSREPRFVSPLPREVGVLGCDPFDPQDLDEFLERHGVVPRDTDENCDVVVLGRKGWTAAEIDQLIDSRVGQILKMYSQEMFLVYMTLRFDPFYATPLVLEAFKAHHPGLELVSRGWAGWVTTFVQADRRSGSTRRPLDGAQVEESPLHVMGYRVGKTGEAPSTRRSILRKAFTSELPIVGSVEYMASWGEPSSPERLKKIADNIAAYSRGQRSRVRPSEEAIEDWESDLDWLREQYYHGHFTFHWASMYV